MRTKLSYEVIKEESYNYNTGKMVNTVVGRSAVLTLSSKNESEIDSALTSFDTYLQNNSDYTIAFSTIERNETVVLMAEIEVSDKDEYNEIKELYTAWKESLKAQPVVEIATEQPSNEVVEVVAEQNENTVSTPVTEIKIENSSRTADLEQNTTIIIEQPSNSITTQKQENTNVTENQISIIEQDQKSVTEQIDIEDLLDRTATIQTSKTTYTGKIYDVNRTKNIVWIETIEDIYELRLSDVTAIKLST